MTKESSDDTQKNKMKPVLLAIKANGRSRSMSAPEKFLAYIEGGRPRSNNVRKRPGFLSPKFTAKVMRKPQSSGKQIVKAPISDISTIFSKMKLKENNPPIKNSVVKK